MLLGPGPLTFKMAAMPFEGPIQCLLSLIPCMRYFIGRHLGNVDRSTLLTTFQFSAPGPGGRPMQISVYRS